MQFFHRPRSTPDATLPPSSEFVSAPHLAPTAVAGAAISRGPGARRPPRLSVIVPVYGAGPRIVGAIGQLTSALSESRLRWEVIVVVDGDPSTLAAASLCRSRRVSVVGYHRRQGKGYAIRVGMAHALGTLVTFIDADMEISPDEIGRMARLLDLYKADVVVGSKRHPLSQVSYPPFRRVQSFAYQVLVHLLFDVKVRDTQTGLKMMRREVAECVARVALVKEFAFDLELLVLATHFGYGRIIECPVSIKYGFQSTVSVKAAFAVLWDTAAIYYRLRVVAWYDRATASASPQTAVEQTIPAK